MQNPTTAEEHPGVPPDRGSWLWGLGSGPALEQNTPCWALAMCFSFIVGVWGGGWGREGRAITWILVCSLLETNSFILHFISFGAED